MIFKKIKAKEDDVFKNKIEVAETSKGIFKKNSGIIFYPVIGAILSIAAFVLLIYATKGSGAVVLALILWYLLFNIIVAFFNTASVACAKIAVNGNKSKFSYGIKEAFKRMNLVINWALFEGTFGLFMGVLADLKMTKSFSYTGEISWGFVKYFIPPFIVFENKEVKDAIGESQKMIKKSWGKRADGEYRVSFVSMAAFIIVLCILIFSSVWKDELITYSLFVLTIFTFILGSMINFSLRSIFFTILYMNAKGKIK